MALITSPELCAILRVDKATLWRYRQNGMPFYCLSLKTYRYDLQEVLDWLRDSGRGGEQNDLNKG